MKKTNALRLLDAAGLPYRTLAYTYHTDDLSVAQIAVDNRLEASQIYKTLVAKGDKTGVLVAVVPGDRSLDFKRLARASGNKKIALVTVKELLALTGYVRGGCSPIGMKKPYPVYIDDAVQGLEEVLVNAGARGLLVGLSPSDLARVCEANVAKIC